MASLIGELALGVLALCAGAGLTSACSPEAERVRDDGPGADPGNKPLVVVRDIDPQPADTTLWPGHAPTPQERLQAGTMYRPRLPTESSAAPKSKASSRAQHRAFEKSAADPSRPERR